ncbi:phospholipase [Myxococcus sp. Y35]|uniref:carboxylesterase family protein n=1 Tax=Pseudomyxococcus flavus TaxID=3115648 RepID=UPI003CF3142E
MQRIAIAAAVAVLAACGPASEQGATQETGNQPASLITPVEDQISVHLKNTLGNPLPFGVYIPPGYNASTELYPTVIHLNGIGELGVATDEAALYDIVTRNGALKHIRNSATWKAYFGQKKALVFVPQAINNYVPAEIRPFVRYIVANYRVDPKRVYLTGLSFGGRGSWQYAELYGSELAALATSATNIGPQGTTLTQMNDVPVWSTSSYGDRWAERDWLLTVTKNYNYWSFPPVTQPSQVTTYLFDKTTQNWTSQPGVVATGSSILRWVVYPGNAHMGWNETYSNQAFWDWMFSKQRP